MGRIKVKLSHVKKEREAKRYANDKTGDNGQPQPLHAEASALDENENPEHQRRNDDIHAKEASDAVGKQLMEEKREVEAVLQKPRSELRVRQKHAQGA